MLMAVPALTVTAQKRKVQNRPYIDMRPMHFGISIGMNMQDIEFQNVGPQTLTLNDGTTMPASVLCDADIWNPGFSVGALADMRLTQRAYDLGLATRERYDLMRTKGEQMEHITQFCRQYTVKATLINSTLEALGMQPLAQSQRLHDLLLRPQLNMAIMAQALPELRSQLDGIEAARRDEIIEAAEIAIKYRGYIERETLIADRVARLDDVTLKGKFDYSQIHQISTEARQKLQAIDPDTVGQASRIPGVSPSDINILLALLGR